MLARLREDLDCVFGRDPAARTRLEVLTTYPGLHAVIIHRITRLEARLAAVSGRQVPATSDCHVCVDGCDPAQVPVSETATAPNLVTGRTSAASRVSSSARGPRLGPIGDQLKCNAHQSRGHHEPGA